MNKTKSINFRESVAKKAKSVKSIREIVVESLREAIVTGQIKPGEHLIERDLSEQMGISTTPIKEAFRILGNEGLVITIPRKGTYVSELVETNIKEISMLRAVIEGLCAELAALKISDEQIMELDKQIERMESFYLNKDAEALAEENTKFHNLIREIANNPMITNILNNIASFEMAFRKRALKETRELNEGFTEHRTIIEAIKSKEAEKAKKLMEKHIIRTSSDVLK